MSDETIASAERPIRIAMDGRYLTSTVLRGMDRYTVSLASALIRRGVDVTFLGRTSQPLHPSHLARSGARMLLLADRGAVWWEQLSVRQALREHGFDVYHAPAERGVPFSSAYPVIFTWHSATAYSYAKLIERGTLPGRLEDYLGTNPFTTGPRFHRWYYGRQPHWADAILTVSEFARREIIDFIGIPADRVHVTPLAVDEVFSATPSDEDRCAMVLSAVGVRRPFILYVGGYERHKNVDGLLRCFAACRAACAELNLVVVGTGSPPAEVKRRAEELGIASAVVCLANLSEALVPLYDAAEVFLSLSWRESFGLPALEALSRGVPVVVSGWGASEEVVGSCATLIDPRDPEAAAPSVLAALSRRRVAADVDMRRGGARYFSWDRCAELTLTVYRDLLSRRRRRR